MDNHNGQNAPLDCILLVDDNVATNFLNEFIIQQENLASDVHFVDSGEAALQFIMNEGPYADKSLYPTPNLILLDINMPKMNGFEVLDALTEMSFQKKESIMICMLSTSERLSDRRKATQYPLVHSFGTKPLNKAWLRQMCSDYTYRLQQKAS